MTFQPIAITGVSVLFPGSTDPTGFWRDITAGRDLLSEVPPTYWDSADYFDPDPKAPDRAYSRRGGFISPVPFDPLANGVPPNVLPATDNAQLLGLVVAERALNDALGGGRFPKVDRGRVSVILGATGTTELIGHMSGRIERPRWEAALRAGGFDEEQVKGIADRIADQFAPWQENTFPGFLGNVIAGRIANRLDLGGTNCVVDAACASSLAALRMAVQELTTGDSDLVLTGGVDALNVPLMYMAFSKTGALSRSGDCRPYSDQADGTILADGVGVLALRRLADAERDGDQIYAVIRGLGSSSDGRAKSIYAPVAEGQARAVRRAYEVAGFSPTTVELVEGHGTGTTAGDKAEVAGLSLAFDTPAGETPRRQWCALGSVKSQIGHAKGAAGVAGLFKAVMALHHKVLPPTIKVDRPNPAFDLANSPFYLNTRLRPWVRDGEHPRRAGVSSAGFGGTNFHVVLEEYAGPTATPPRVRPASAELIPLSAADVDGLAAGCEQVLQECDSSGDGVDGLQRIARRTQERFSVGAARLSIVATDLSDLKQKLSRALQSIREHPGREVTDPSGVYFAVGKQPGEVAFLFPGQGSQYVGMGQDLALALDDARAVWDRAAGVPFDGGERLHEVVFPRPAFDKSEEAEQAIRLTRTQWAQPALAACSMAAEAVLRRLGLSPAFAAGHSFGELSALRSAGVFAADDLIRAARKRGELMAAASDVPGAMTAVRASATQVEQALGHRHPQVLIANRNSPRQVVLSGATDAVAAAEADLTVASLAFKRLPVATAFHSPLVSPSVEPFRAFMQSIPVCPPKGVVFSNTTADPYPEDADLTRDLLAQQLASPVRFEEVIHRMAERGVRTFIEVGAGGVLTGLVGECLQGTPHLAVAVDRKGQPGLTSLWHCLGQLAVQGVTLNWMALWQGHADTPVPKAPPAHAIMVGGSSKGRKPEASSAATTPLDVRTPAPIGRGKLELGKAIPTPPDATPAVRPATTAHVIPRAPTIPSGDSGTRQAALPGPPKSPPTTVADTTVAAPSRSAVKPLAHPANFSPIPEALRPMPTENHAKPSAVPAPAVERTPATARTPAGLHDAVRGILSETARVQEAYQNLMADSAQRFLESVERSIQRLTGGEVRSVVELPPRREQIVEPPPADPRPTPRAEIVAARQPEPVHNLPRPETVPQPPPAVRAPDPVHLSPAIVPAAVGVDVEKALLGVVSEKTGYPADLLTWDADMEAGLGIDSIKRVEILSALEAVVPGMAGTDPAQMFALRTLGDVRELLRTTAGNAPVVPTTIPAPNTATSATQPAGLDVEKALLGVVAEKTGYPTDLLGWDMDMEAGLGIDSIKRVEILSALEAVVPGMAGTDPAQMFALRTLGDVRELLRIAAGNASTEAPAASISAPAALALPVASSTGLDVEKALLGVVSEKTGYPADLLTWDADMEAGLGIDSIKRVEILSALEAVVPGMAGTDPAQMFALRTLGDVRELLRTTAGANSLPSAGGDPVMPSPVEPAAPAVSTAFPRRTVQVVDAPPSGFAMTGLRQASPLVIVACRRADGDEVAEVALTLADRLNSYGLDAVVAPEATVEAGGVIFLGGLRPIEGAEQGRQVLVQALLSAKAFATAAQIGGVFVTVQDTGGDFGLSGCGFRAWVGGLSGLAKTAAIEWPAATVKAIDLEQGGRTPEELADALLGELLAGGGDVEVGLRANGQRVTVACVPSPLPTGEHTPAVATGDVVVVSGGARGVTAAALIGLTRVCKPRFVLLGRTPLEPEPAFCLPARTEGELVQALLRDAQSAGRSPTPAELRGRAKQILQQREVYDNIASLKRAGAEVRYVTVDVRDRAALAEHLTGVRRDWGPIRGVIHAAGIVADRLIKDKTPEQIEQVFSVKIDGLHALLEATAADPLKLLCLFSSAAGRFGNQGQSDYSMANEVLNKVADAERRRRGTSCVVKSINWGAWEGGMVTPSLKEHFAAKGVRLLPLEEGGRQFAAELTAVSGGVEIVLGVADTTDPFKANRPVPTAFDVVAADAFQGYLHSHCVEDDTPVLPVVQVLEWFVRAGSTFWPEEDVCCRDLKVLSGVQLRDFERGEWFRIACRRTGEQSVEVELRRADVRHYSAVLEVATPHSRTAFVPGVRNDAERQVLTRSAGAAYDDGKLFHGPQFQVLRSYSDLTDSRGGRAALTGTGDMRWGSGPWVTDPAAIDGGLQLALLWGLEHRHLKSLPTRFEAYVTAGGSTGPVRFCDLRVRPSGRHEVVADLRFSDAEGRPVCDLRGVTMTLLQGSKVKVPS